MTKGELILLNGGSSAGCARKVKDALDAGLTPAAFARLRQALDGEGVS